MVNLVFQFDIPYQYEGIAIAYEYKWLNEKKKFMVVF